MALVKQPVSINFSRGLDLKSDPYQVSVGNFLSLNNTVFTTTGRLTKRYGFSNITTLPNANQSILTTLNDNLLATGTNIYSYASDVGEWFNKGNVQPIQLDTTPLVRVGTSQTSPDTAIAPNGLCCLVYVDNSVAYYQISDSETGDQIIARTTLESTAANPRVFVLGNFFIITYMATISASPHLRYVAVPYMNPAAPRSAVDLATTVESLTIGYDGYVLAANNTLYFAWGSASGSVSINSMTSGLVINSATTLSGLGGDMVNASMTNDALRQMIVVAWNTGTAGAIAAAFNYSLTQTMNASAVSGSGSSTAITCVSTGGVATIFWQVTNNYSYTSSLSGDNIRSDYLTSVTLTLPATVGTGTYGTPVVGFVRSVGLASKAFFGPGNTIYMLVAYGCETNTSSLDNSNQPSYFLIDSAGSTYMRLAYSNGGGYTSSFVLPSVTNVSGSYFLPYLNNDFLAPVNKGTNLATGTPTNAIYTQTGVNLAEFSFNTNTQYSSQIAGALHLTGGQLWEYDGVRPVEHGFHVWPENVSVIGSNNVGGLVAGVTYFWQFTYEWTDNAGNLHRSAPSIPISYTPVAAATNFTAKATSGSPTLTNVSSFTGLQVGQPISGTDIHSGAYITALNVGASTLTMSNNATGGSATTVTVTPTAVSSVTLNIPNDRLTYKIAPNPIRIVGYRWSTNQQVYYQFTSLTSPIVNSTTSDSSSTVDLLSDANILGNTIIYTTGGVIEDIAAPASKASALFNNRLFLIDAEDQNLLWYSKQVIENVPVEMSDLLTLYVAPTTGVQGSTGPMTALGAMDDKLIIFKKDAIYYINGQGPDNTGNNNGFSDPVFVTSSVGSANPNSIVLIPNGLMFQSDKGIWLLGRDLSTNYIGAPVESYNSQIVESATAIPGTTQVRFITSGNITLMYDYFFNQWATHSNKQAISATLYQGAHTYLNNQGLVFQETPGTYLDGSTPVLLSLTTSWINVAGLQGYERFYFANLLGTYYSPFTLSVGLAYNYNPSNSQAITVTPNNYTVPYGDETVYGGGGTYGSDQAPGSGSPANVFSARLWPTTQKCQSFQVSIQEVYDPSYGVAAGEGLTLSGLALILGVKKGWRTQSATKSFG